jgi:RNA polymerase sigma factor (sigma-70 family)
LRDGGGLTDGQLLECFVRRRDEAAFEALVRRHGPMVLGVCRRVLRSHEDAEDAFQATFLVLVRKASAIGQRHLLGNWLYGVAYRTALDARAAAARRRARERQGGPMPEPEAAGGAEDGRDLRALLDQELNRLPDKYRVPVVLCDLEGRTRRNAALQLGIPAGTLSGRLTTARRMLARRLARHGLGLSVGALTAALRPDAASACLSPLVVSTVKAATATAAGQAVGVVSARVAALAAGVLKAMLVRKLKAGLTLMLAAAAVLGAALLAHPPRAAQAPAAPAQEATAPPPDRAAAAPRVLRLGSRGRRVVWSPDSKTLAIVTINESILFRRTGSTIRLWDVDSGTVRDTLAESPDKGLAFQSAAFSTDGKLIAATVAEGIGRDVVKLWDARTRALKRTLGGESQLACVALSPDVQRVAAGSPARKAVELWNAGKGMHERTLDTEGVQPWSLAFAPDGKTLAVGGQADDHSGRVQLWDTGVWGLKQVLRQDKYVNSVAFSPDGKAVAASMGGAAVSLWKLGKGAGIVTLEGSRNGQRSVAFSPDGTLVAAGGWDGKVRLWDARTGELKETLQGHQAEVHAVAFSPDGRTLASVSQDETLRLWPIAPATRPR